MMLDTEADNVTNPDEVQANMPMDQRKPKTAACSNRFISATGDMFN